MAEPAAMSLERVTKNFAGVRAVQDITLELYAGRVTGVIGPNGAGKSTMINLASGLIRPTAGVIRLGGGDVTRVDMAKRARMGIRRSFQHPHLLAGSDVRSMLSLAARAPGATGEARDPIGVAERFGLGTRLDQAVQDLPYGFQKLVNLAMLWLAKARVVLLDEPYAGVGPEHRDAVSDAIRAMAEDGAAVALVEHSLEIVAELTTQTVVLDLGRVIFDGSTEAALSDAAVLEAYLGQGAGR